MATEEQIMNTNRLSSLTYMISACLEFSIQNLNRQLDLCNLRLLDRGGTDNLCDLRLMALVDKISIYPGMKLSYQMAFAQVTKAISKGEFSKEDFKNLLEVYEDGTEKTKG